MPLKAAAVTADVQLAILSGEGLAASCGILGGREMRDVMRDVVLCTEYVSHQSVFGIGSVVLSVGVWVRCGP
jgi:hypothetical protein